jgi:hypothetical protein
MIATALWLLAAQGLFGAFDTVYFHEWKARLPALGRTAAPELVVHALRDFLYAVLFATLPWFAWRGVFAVALAAVIVTEIGLTFTDFVIEIRVRKPLGDVYAGERITHATMAIIYGAVLANLAPQILAWWGSPTAFAYEPAPIPTWLRVALTLMGAGVASSGLRDLYAACGPAGASWPWRRGATSARSPDRTGPFGTGVSSGP